MRTTKDQFFLAMAVGFTLMLLAAGDGDGGGDGGDDDQEDDEHPGKIRHGRKLGKYKYKEEVIKRVEFNHPCRLAQTAVKVTFPGMKSEVLVSFLGYKEPNLMHVMRCKGTCSNKALSPVACVATKRKLKRVKMRLKTQVLGSEAKEKFQELVLEEHEECGCQCLSVTPAHCLEPDSFNNETCSCACDNSPFSRDQLQCEAYAERKWEPVTCTCRHKDDVIIHQTPLLDGNHKSSGGTSGEAQGNMMTGTTPDTRRGHDVVQAIPGCTADDCASLNGCSVSCIPGHEHSSTGGIAAMPNATTDNSSSLKTWLAVGVCSIFICLLAFTTCYYRRKSRRLQIAKSDEDAALLVQSSTILDDKFNLKMVEANSAANQASMHNGDTVSPSFELIENYCDNPPHDNNENGRVVVRNHSNLSMSNHQQHHQQYHQPPHRHQTAVHASQSHQTLAMLPMRDDGVSTLGGLVNALLGVRTTGNRTHEVVVHSPGYMLNGGNSLAKAASMSELDQPLITRTPHHRLHAESVGTVIAQSHASLGASHGTLHGASLGAVDFFDMSTSPSTFCHTCVHSSLSRHGRQAGNKHHHQHHQSRESNHVPPPTRNYQQPYNLQQQHHRSQHLHRSPSSSHQHQQRYRHDTEDPDYDDIEHHMTPVRRSKNRHRKHKSQEHLIDPEQAAELLQKCLLTLGDSSGIVLQKLTQKQQQQVQLQQQKQQQPQEQSDLQKLRRCLHNKVSSSTATSPC